MIVTMYRRKWKFSVMSTEDAEDFIRQPHFERIRFISITEANGHHIDFHKFLTSCIHLHIQRL